jgi:hypothetical protein
MKEKEMSKDEYDDVIDVYGVWVRQADEIPPEAPRGAPSNGLKRPVLAIIKIMFTANPEWDYMELVEEDNPRPTAQRLRSQGINAVSRGTSVFVERPADDE